MRHIHFLPSSLFFATLAVILVLQAVSLNATVLLKNIDLQFSDQPAAFGASIPEDGIEGRLRLPPFNNNFGCNPFTPQDINRNENIIMLVTRGNCSFLHKVRAMEQSGASAVIVGDNRQQSDLISMYADGPADDISIPSTFVDSASFGYLFKMADWQAYTNNPTDGMVQILPNAINYESLTRSFFSLLPSLLFLCIVFYSVVNGIMARRRRNRYLLNGGLLSSSREGSFGEFGRRGGRRFSGDTISVVQVNHNLKNLSSKQFVIKEIKENDALCCAICLDDFEDGQSLVVLSCNHHYHPDCIKAWLIKMTPHLCPICKKEVLCSCGGGSSDGEEGEEEDGEDAVFDADQLAHLGVAALTTSHNSGSRSGRSTTADELLSSSSLSSSTAASPTASENGGGDEDSDPLVIRRRPGNDNNNNNTVESSSSSSSSNSTPTVMNWTSWQAIRRSWNALSGGGDVGGGTSDTQV